MIKQVFAGVVAIGSVSGVASGQTYLSISPPPAAFAPPLVIGAPIPIRRNSSAPSIKFSSAHPLVAHPLAKVGSRPSKLRRDDFE